jgi:4-hydroxybenzoyl-CoA thioesterase
MVFSVKQKVRFQHCDPAGIVFYPRYFEMINAAVEDWFEERLQAPFGRMHGPDAHGVPTARIEIAFTAPSRIGEELTITLRPTKLGRTSVDLAISAMSGEELRFRQTSTLVHISLGSGRPVAWPEAVRARIAGELEGGTDHAQ